MGHGKTSVPVSANAPNKAASLVAPDGPPSPCSAPLAALSQNESRCMLEDLGGKIAPDLGFLSPTLGFVWTQFCLPEKLYKYTSNQTALGRVMRHFFFRTEGVEFAPTRHLANAASYIGFQTIGRMASLTATLSEPEALKAALVTVLNESDEIRKSHLLELENHAEMLRAADFVRTFLAEDAAFGAMLDEQRAHCETDKAAAKFELGRYIKAVKGSLSDTVRARLNDVEGRLARLRKLGPKNIDASDSNDPAHRFKVFTAQKLAIEAEREACIEAEIDLRGAGDRRRVTALRQRLANAFAQLAGVDDRRAAYRATWRERVLQGLSAEGIDSAPIERFVELDIKDFRLGKRLISVLAQKQPANSQALVAQYEAIAGDIVGSISECDGEASCIAKILMSFAWGKAKTRDDVEKILTGFVSDARARTASRALVKRDDNLLQAYERAVHGSFFPPLCVTALSKADAESVVFADCGESSVRNFLNVLLHDHDCHKLNADFLRTSGLSVRPEVIGFFEKNHSIANVSLQSVHNQWASVTSHIPVSSGGERVRYLSPARNSYCELAPGGRNVLRVLKYLLGTDDVADIVSRIAKASGRDIECDLSAFEPDNNELPDFSNKIAIQVGGHTFEWCFLKRHFRTRTAGPEDQQHEASNRKTMADLSFLGLCKPDTQVDLAPYIIPLKDLAPGKVAPLVSAAPFTPAQTAELVLACNLSHVDAVYEAAQKLIEIPEWTQQPLLLNLLKSMLLSLPRHPDHMPKRFAMAERVVAKQIAPLYDICDELRTSKLESWLDTQLEGAATAPPASAKKKRAANKA